MALMPKRMIAAARWTLNLLHSAFLTVFLGLAAMVLAAWLGAGGWATIGAAVLGLLGGATASRRIWFAADKPVGEETAPARKQTGPAPWRPPGIQDQFARLCARQRVLAFLLISALLMLAALRFALAWNWPTLFGIPRERLLAGALLLVAVVLPLGLLNWRCPNCRRNLGRTLAVRQCPRCGVVLRD